MFLPDWFFVVLAWLGFGQEEATILICGEDDALQRCLPVIFSVEQPGGELIRELRFGRIKFKFIHLGDYKTVGMVLRDYNYMVDAVVFVMDSDFCWSSFRMSKKGLYKLLSIGALANVPLLIRDFGLNSTEESLYRILGLPNPGQTHYGDAFQMALSVH